MSVPETPEVLPLREAGRSLLPHLRPHRTAIAVAVLLSLVGAATALAQPLAVAAVVRVVQDGSPLAPVAALLVAVVLLGAVTDGARQFLLERAGAGVVLGVRTSLVTRLARLTVAARDARASGDLLSRVSGDTTALAAVVTSGLFDLLATVLTFLGAVVLMAVLDPVLLAVTLVAIAVAGTAIAIASSRLGRLTLATQTEVGAMSSAVGRVLGALRTLRASGATDRELDGVVAAARRARDAAVRASRVRALLGPAMQVSVQGAFVAVLGVGGARVASGATSVAELVGFVLLLFTLVAPLGQLVQTWTVVQAGAAALTRVQEVLALPVEQDEPRHEPRREPRPAAAVPAQRAGEVPLLEFDDVAFAYPDGTPALRGASFAVPRGTRTALVGPSGAGKSTLLSLVERFHDAGAGSVRVDGVDVRDLPRAALRARLGYVEQDAPVLAGTLRENLVLAAPDATDEEVLAALDAVGLRELAERGPGLAAEVGERGVLLSGGQRQRLAIARALLGPGELLLLDEPTASLDARNEALLREALAAAADRRTLVVVAHRLSTVVDSDQIVVLEDGRTTAAGTHAQLLERSPLYRELAATQLLVGPS
ncbi:ABC transporter ATP-binding protein/permease [Kineococcus sp. TRM81007]|uniref:ABC transporter ATP-binding protein n=1 Tax=Kineococcus sp. TRM81007 TaxID=2925831 RepID=UPI001F5951DC|nr:ABC transporter ATP-binding protein [Kineococcus sp. TRM81007]MCI2239352.1 ABC transporter ATP-binding protein/permease [Kineococcus sp. TRM81007]